jgi:hypothetical protein
MEIRLEQVNLVLIPMLIAPSFVATVVFLLFLCVEKGLNHGRSDRVPGVIIGMTPAALPLSSCNYLVKTCST